MVGPVRVDGLSSGIDYTGIIEKLLAAQRRPITKLQERVTASTEKKTSLLQLNAGLLVLKGIADSLSRPSFFGSTRTTSTDDRVLKASGTQVGAFGAYSFSVRQMASAHQVLSKGFADADRTVLTTAAAEVSVEVGGGHITRNTLLETLNGGLGVDRGKIIVTDSAGDSSYIDLEGAVTVQDVLNEINSTEEAGVRAFLAGDRIVLQDLGGGPPAAFNVQNVGGDTTATDLGIVGSGVATGTGTFIFGQEIHYAGGSSSHLLLNDGLGVRRNSNGVADFSVTGPDGVSFSVDLQSSDLTISQIVSRINSSASAAGSNVVASLTPDGTALQLDGTGGAGFTVSPLNSSMAAVDLGFGNYEADVFQQVVEEDALTGAAAPGTGEKLLGNRILSTMNSVLRNQLNGGQTHSTAAVSLTAPAVIGATTLSVASVNGFSVGDRIQIRDGATEQIRRISSISGNVLTLDEGLSAAVAAIGTVNDKQGVSDGTVSFTDRSGASFSVNLDSRIRTTSTAAVGVGATSITLSSVDGFSVGNKIRIVDGGVDQWRTITGIAGNTVSFDVPLGSAAGLGAGVSTDHATLGQILNTINDRAAANGVRIRAEANSQGNGIRILDTTGANGTLTVSDVSGTVAADLGIAGSTSTGTLLGTDLDALYLSPYTNLSQLNGRTGVQAGRFRITDRSANQIDVDLGQANDTTLDAVIQDINGAASAAGSALRARVNNTGDGLILIDTGGGTGTVRVEELGSTRTARDLGLSGSAPSATPGTLNGSFEKRVTIQAGARLQDVRTALNSSGLPITVSLINDGSPTNPYHLVVLSKITGEAGRLVIDSNIPGLGFETTATPRDSVLLYGSNGGVTDPVLLTSSSNRYTDVVPGLTLDLLSESESDVTVTVSRDTDAVTSLANRFVEKYNEFIQKLNELTFFDPAASKKGPLFGDPTARRIRTDLENMLSTPVNEIPSGNLRTLQEVGFKLTQQGGLTLDSGKLQTQLDTRFDQVQELFTRQRRLTLDTAVSELNNGSGIRTVGGADMRIRTRSATKDFTVDLDGLSNIASVLSAINNAAGNGGAITASISSDGFSLVLTDNTTVPTRTVEAPATATSFVETDADVATLANGYLIGSTVTFLSGANAGQVRKVTGFDDATDTITLDSALPVALTAGDSYRLERELEAEAVSGSTAGKELKLVKKARLSDTSLKGDLINLKNDPGIGFRLGERLDVMTRSENGMISIRTDTLDDTIDGFNKTIQRIEERLRNEEERLVRKFARLEVLLANNQSLSGQLQASLQGMSALVQGGAQRR